jgi:hypothetical protein
MKLSGILNLRGISGQIAALVVASIVAMHLIITVTFLIHRPDQFDAMIDHGHGQLAAAVQLLGAAPATERPRLTSPAPFRSSISKAFHRASTLLPPTRPASSSACCIAASAPATGSLRSGTTPIPARLASCCRTAR